MRSASESQAVSEVIRVTERERLRSLVTRNKRIEGLVRVHEADLMKAWDEYFNLGH